MFNAKEREDADMVRLINARQRYVQAILELRRNDRVDRLLRNELQQAVHRIDAKLAMIGEQMLATTH
ncbi:MAG: hypothetical protein AB8B85_18430 [Paracoccaceae bacterium]